LKSGENMDKQDHGPGKLLGAIDLGGTKILSALFNADGDIFDFSAEAPTPTEKSPAELVGSIAANLLEAVMGNGREISEVASLGIGVPTTIQYEAGLIDGSPNLPRVKDYPLADELSACLGLPVVMEKDANCFLLGEMNYGAAVGCASCCGVTLGTGLGLGVAIESRLVRGSNSCAGEIWTSPYGDGIIEDWVSGTALAAQYCRAGGEKLTGAEIHQRAAEGEQLARRVLHQLGEVLGFGLSYLVNVLNPEVVVVGGSVARAWDFFSAPMQLVVDKHRVKRNVTKIIPGNLGGKASLYGAISLLKP
jgi:glucokinase